MSAAEPLAGAAVASSARSRFADGMPLGIRLALGFLLLMVVASLLAPAIAPYDFATQNLARRLRPPVFWGGDWAYVLGTDHLGRDILSRLIYGIRTSIAIALAGTLIGAAIGTVLGYVAARRRGWLDDVIMMMVDVQAALSGLRRRRWFTSNASGANGGAGRGRAIWSGLSTAARSVTTSSSPA